MEFYESPDGIGRAVGKSTYLGTTYVDLVGEGFRGSYALSTLAVLEDHSEELLSRLPAQGVELPYDPRPRYTNPGEATIEPDHKLPANLNPTNSVQNITQPDSNIMDVFPTDTHRYVTPYHSASFASALQSLGDAEVNPQEHNDSLEPIESDPGYAGEDHSTHTPFTDDPFVDGNFDDEMSDPTTEEWGVPAVQTFPAHGASVDIRGGRPEPRLHFQREAELPKWLKDKKEEEKPKKKGLPDWMKDDSKPEEKEEEVWDVSPGGWPHSRSSHLEGDDAEEGEFVDDFGEDAEGTFSDHEAAWENQSPKWDELPSKSTLDESFNGNNWQDRTMAPNNSQQDGAQVDPHGADDSGGNDSEKKYDKSEDGPWEDMDYNPHLKDSTFDFLGDYKYIKPAGDGKYKIVQKGTGDTLSTHDSKEEAEASFRAMEMHKHEGAVKQTPQGWFYIGPGGHNEGPFPTPAGAQQAETAAKEEDSAKNSQEQGAMLEPEKIASFGEEEIPRPWKQYFAFLDNDRDAREAAWVDVRAKGQRLAREGHVHVDKYTSFQTDAQVQGDSGTYNVTLYRTAGWSKGVAHYSCNCEWGKWAWRRHFYYGRFCSHGYATYLENQKLDSRRRNGPIDDNVSVGLLATTGAAWDGWNNGDQVRLTDHHDASEVDGDHVVTVVPGDTGEIISIPYEDSAEVRMHHGGPHDSDVNIPFDKLEKIGFAMTAFEEHDDDSGNENWGSEAFSQEYQGDTGSGGGSGGDDQDDGIPDGVTSSYIEAKEKSVLDPDQWNPQHDKDIHIFSEDPGDDLHGQEVPHVPENDRLRTMTTFDDPRFADATNNDEMDNPSMDAQISSPETEAGGSDFGNVQESDQNQTTAQYHHAALDWLNEEPESSGFSGGGLVDPILAAKLSGVDSGQRKITKSSAKIYTPMEQFALVEEDGRSELVDHLNLANSFYEM